MPSLKSGSLPHDVMALNGGRFTFLNPHAPPLSSGPAPSGAPYQVALASSQPSEEPLVLPEPEPGLGVAGAGGGVTGSGLGVAGAGVGVGVGAGAGQLQQPLAASSQRRTTATT